MFLSYVGVRERRKGSFVDPPPSHKVLGHFEPKFSWTYWWEIVLCTAHNWSFFKKLFGSSDGVNLKILYRYFVTKMCISFLLFYLGNGTYFSICGEKKTKNSPKVFVFTCTTRLCLTVSRIMSNQLYAVASLSSEMRLGVWYF